MVYFAISGFHGKKCNSMEEAKEFVRDRKGWRISIYSNGKRVATIRKSSLP